MKKLVVFFVMVLFSILVTSCASAQPTAEEKERMTQDIEGYELPIKPTDSTAVVYVIRPNKAVVGLVPFKVSVDDVAEKLSNGSIVVYVLNPGEHNLYVKAENTNLIPFTADAGQVYFYLVHAKWSIYGRAETEPVDEIYGTYQIKQLYDMASTAVVNLVDENQETIQ